MIIVENLITYMFAEYWEIIFMFIKAFVVGGLICVVAQVVINFTDLTAGTSAAASPPQTSTRHTNRTQHKKRRVEFG
jgi:hypothetical protein